MLGGRGARCFGGSTGPRRVRPQVGSLRSPVVTTPRYRCTACGNLTRFDVTTTSTVRSFNHYSVGGELTVEESEVLSERVDDVRCRWCGTGGSVEAVTPPA